MRCRLGHLGVLRALLGAGAACDEMLVARGPPFWELRRPECMHMMLDHLVESGAPVPSDAERLDLLLRVALRYEHAAALRHFAARPAGPPPHDDEATAAALQGVLAYATRSKLLKALLDAPLVSTRRDKAALCTAALAAAALMVAQNKRIGASVVLLQQHGGRVELPLLCALAQYADAAALRAVCAAPWELPPVPEGTRAHPVLCTAGASIPNPLHHLARAHHSLFEDLQRAEALVARGYRVAPYRYALVDGEGALRGTPVLAENFGHCDHYRTCPPALSRRPFWMIVDRVPWSAATHHEFPAKFKLAAQAVLLAAHGGAARRRRGGDAEAAPVGLHDLPQSAVLRVLELAAFPLSKWVRAQSWAGWRGRRRHVSEQY